ncbi:MAG: FemAB family protein [Lentimonas sp.]|jgi:FemAB family protein
MNIIEAKHPTFKSLWHKLFLQSELRYPTYQDTNLEFYRELRGGNSSQQYSFIVMERDIPFCGLLAVASESSTGYELSVYGEPVLFLEAGDIPKEKSKGAKAVFSSHFNEIINNEGLSLVRHRDFLQKTELSIVSKLLLKEGASVRPEFVEVIDLSLTEDELYSQVNKSFKSLINWGKKNLSISVFDASNISPEVISEFQTLHLAVAGRKTRSDKTWIYQLDMVMNKEAFIVTGRLQDELVTAALFSISEIYCLYGVSASNRDMFDKPLSHSILWRAICHAKTLGCQHFEMGERKFKHLGSPTLPTPKELGISKFKTGFGEKTTMRLDIQLERDRA